MLSDFFAALMFDTIGSFAAPQGTSPDRIVKAQIASGLKILTDGHIHRKEWDNSFFKGLTGMEETVIGSGHIYQEYPAMTTLLRLTGRIEATDIHPAIVEFKALRDITPKGYTIKQTMPAPSHFLAKILDDNIWKSIYSNQEELCRDIARAYRKTLLGLYSEGCRFVQFDDCSWEPMMYAGGIKYLLQGGTDIERHISLLIDINNDSIDGLSSDMTIAHYVCRGSYDSPRYRRVDYSFIAPRLFAESNADMFYLDLNVDSDNDYSILRYMPDGKKVMLGIVSPFDTPDNPSQFIETNLNEASLYRGSTYPGISFRCGMNNPASLLPSPETQWTKVDRLNSIVTEIFRQHAIVQHNTESHM